MDLTSLLPFLMANNNGGSDNPMMNMIPNLMGMNGGGNGGGDMTSMLMNMMMQNGSKGNAQANTAQPQGGTGKTAAADAPDPDKPQQSTVYDTNPQYLKRYYTDKKSFDDIHKASPSGTQTVQQQKAAPHSGGKSAQDTLNDLINKNNRHKDDGAQGAQAGAQNTASSQGTAQTGNQNNDMMANLMRMMGGMNGGGTGTPSPGGGLDPMSLMSMMGGMNGGGAGGLNPMMLMSLLNNNRNGAQAQPKAQTASVNVNANLTQPIETFAPSSVILNIRRMLS